MGMDKYGCFMQMYVYYYWNHSQQRMKSRHGSKRIYFFQRTCSCLLDTWKKKCQVPITTTGLHGLKTEARTRPVPEIVWPDPTRAAQLNLEPEPDPKSPPPPITNKKKKEKDCISRLHAKKRINQGSAISQTFTSYESLWTSGAAVAYILPSLWILFGQEDDDRANYGHFFSVKAR